MRNAFFCNILKVVFDAWNGCGKQQGRSIYASDENGFPGDHGSVRHVWRVNYQEIFDLLELNLKKNGD